MLFLSSFHLSYKIDLIFGNSEKEKQKIRPVRHKIKQTELLLPVFCTILLWRSTYDENARRCLMDGSGFLSGCLLGGGVFCSKTFCRVDITYVCVSLDMRLCQDFREVYVDEDEMSSALGNQYRKT